VASADKISDDALTSVANQLAAFLPPPEAGPAGLPNAPAADEVAESFAVCFVDAAAVKKPPADLGSVLRPAGTWHHQIRRGGTASAVARSAQSGLGGDDFTVQNSFESPIAGRIDEAITWVDKKVKGRTTVRLLVIPAYFVHAFGIERAGATKPAERYTAVLIDQPPGFTKLQTEKEYPLAEFLKLLAQEKPAATLA
jgi:hypothetical protein